MAESYQQDGYPTLTSTLIVEGAAELIEFMVTVFGATQRLRTDPPDGRIAHSELEIGDSLVMVADASEVYPPGAAFLHVYVPDADATYRKALTAGAISLTEPANHFYGDRSSNVRDPWGNRWTISTHV